MSNMQARKDVEKNASMSRTSGKIFKERPWEPRPKCEFTSLGEPLETIFNILLQNHIITLLDNSRPYEPEVKPKWSNNNDYYDYHQSKGHKMSSCVKLKHTI